MIDPRTGEGARLAAAEIAARAEIRRCVALVEDRSDVKHPATRAWREAIARSHLVLHRVYPEDFWSAVAALKQTRSRDAETRNWTWSRAPPASIEIAIRFLEADLVCFRSGYIKERLLRCLARHPLREDDRRRLRGVVLAGLLGPARREFRAVCTLAASVGDPDLLMQVEGHLICSDVTRAKRAEWMRDAIVRGRRARRLPPKAG